MSSGAMKGMLIGGGAAILIGLGLFKMMRDFSQANRKSDSHRDRWYSGPV